MTDLDAINEKLKTAGVRLRVVMRNRKLYLRGTLPPRPGRVKPEQTYLALSLDATPYGYKMATAKAYEVWAAIGQNKFTWDQYTDTTAWDTCSSWIERYKKDWFQRKGDTEKSRILWHREEWLLGLKWLPEDKNLTAKLLTEVAQLKQPNSRSRYRLVQILSRLAKFADIEVNLTPYRGNYSAGKTQPRDIPEDEEIVVHRNAITNPQWRLVYTRMAIYGLRPHEAWYCEIDSKPPHACRVLAGKTGSREGVMPLYPEWAVEWKPWEGELPVVNYKGDNSLYGERAARAFKRLGISYPPYNLRHAWCIRGSVAFGIPVSVMATMAGHSPGLHLSTYSRWISAQQSRVAYTKAISDVNAPKAPTSASLTDEFTENRINVDRR